MVATEPLWQSPVAYGLTRKPVSPGIDIDPSRLPVKQIRELLASLSKPDLGLLALLSRDRRVSVRRLAYHCWTGGGDLASNEDIFREGDISFVAGSDEAGRGALAGPLAAAVMFEPGFAAADVNDSKALLPERREELYDLILDNAVSVSVAFVDSGLVDRWGVQLANLKALGDAIRGLDARCQFVVCDHFSLVGCGVPVLGLPRADATFQSVAAASIIAKVERDRVMRSLHQRFPRYNFAGNKGYGTEEHMLALQRYGPTPFHRVTFNGVLPGDEEISLWRS